MRITGEMGNLAIIYFVGSDINLSLIIIKHAL